MRRCSSGSSTRSRSRSSRAYGRLLRRRRDARRSSATSRRSTRRRSRPVRRRRSSSTRSDRQPGSRRRPRRPHERLVGADVPVHFHGHNDFGLGDRRGPGAQCGAGARWIQGTVNGMGERAGNANLPEIALALRGLYGVETNLRLDQARTFSERLRELSGYDLEPFKPSVGDNLFRRESGAVRAVPRPAGGRRVLVRARRRGAQHRARQAGRHRLDSHQGRGARARPVRDARRDLLAHVKELRHDKHGLVADEEFRQLARGWLDTPSSSAAHQLTHLSPHPGTYRVGAWHVLERETELGGASTRPAHRASFRRRRLQRLASTLGRSPAHAGFGEALGEHGLST